MSAFLLAVLLLIQTDRGLMTDTAGAKEVATEFLEAFRTGDEATVANLTATLQVDPFLVADALLETRQVDAARAFAARVEDASLTALVETCSHWSEEEFVRDAKLRELLEDKSSDLVVALDDAPPGVTGVRLRAAIAAKLFGVDMRAAADAYLEAAERAAEIGWSAERWRNRLRAGLGLANRGAVKEGVGHIDAALVGYRSLGHRVQFARLLSYAFDAYYESAQLDRALEAGNLALREALATDDWDDAVRARLRTFQVYNDRGQRDQALEVLRLAHDDCEAHDDRLRMAAVRGNMGMVYQNMGRYQEALECHRFAHEEKARLGARRGAAISLLNVGLALEAMGRFPDAIDAYEKTRAECLAVDERPTAAIVLNNLANVYAQLGFREKGLEFALRAVEEKKALGLKRSLAYAYMAVATAYSNLKEYDKALEYAELLHREMEAMGNPLSAMALGMIGIAHCGLGDNQKGLEYLLRSREEMVSARLAPAAGFTLYLNNIGRAYHDLGDNDKAIEYYDLAIEMAEAKGDLKFCADMLNTRATFLLELGLLEQALSSASRSVEHRLEGTRNLGAMLGGVKRTYAADASEIGLQAIERLCAESNDDDLPARAFWFAENGRGLLLAESLVNREVLRTDHISSDILSAEAAARRQVAAARARLNAVAMGENPSGESLDAAQAELDEAYAALEHVIERAERECHRAMDVVAPHAIELSSFQKMLPPETALVFYQSIRPYFSALVVTSDDIDFIGLGEHEDLLSRVERYLSIVAIPGSDEEKLAGELYDRLLTPLEPFLEGKTRLLLSPEGILCFLPFEALVSRSREGAVRALECWEIAYVPSATVYAALREDASAAAPGEGLVALADPVYPGPDNRLAAATRALELRGLTDLPPLPGSGEEARAIADLFDGGTSRLLLQAEASVSRLADVLSGTDSRLAALHLACHGYVDTERPFLTGLVLSDAEILSVFDVYRLRVPADLVVLSACETGRGRLQRGEGVLGLTRAFFFAGSPRVIVSNWKVDDRSTRSLMISLYEKIANGVAPAAALRGAKLERIRAGGPEAHPCHWAAFVLWGLND